MDQRPAPLSPTTPGFTQHLVAHHKILSHAGCRDGQVSFFTMAYRVHQWIHCYHIAWGNRWHFTTLPLVSPPNEVWETNAEIPYWWYITTQIWVVPLIGRAAWEIWFNQSGALPRSVKWHVISMGFLRSFLRRHLVGKLVVVSPNVSCFLRLAIILITSQKINSKVEWSSQN